MKLCLKFQVKILKNVGKNREKDQSWSFLIKIGPILFLSLIFSYTFQYFFSLALKLSCGAMIKISSKNIEKCDKKSKKGPILVGPFLLNLCQGNVIMI